MIRPQKKNEVGEWAWARVELGLTAAEYLDLTPREFDALVGAWRRKETRKLTQAADLKAFLANIYCKKEDGTPFTAADFLPQEPMTSDDVMVRFRAAFDQPEG